MHDCVATDTHIKSHYSIDCKMKRGATRQGVEMDGRGRSHHDNTPLVASRRLCTGRRLLYQHWGGTPQTGKGRDEE